MAIIHCLGAGLVGSYVACRLADAGHEVHVIDMQPNPKVIDYPSITIHNGDALAYCEEIGDSQVDLVVNMLPGEIGKIGMRILCENSGGKFTRIVDLSFSDETPDRYHKFAQDCGVKVLWDVGIAPGLSNMLLAEAYRVLGRLSNAEVRVGGNPTKPTSGWNYMAPFSPKDVIAEYTRPARVIRSGGEVVLPALSERHFIEVPEHGQMEAFLTDGLRSLLDTIPAVEMSEYTVRWPGHIQRFIDERDTGELDEDKLLREWWYDHKIPEFTWMEVMAESLDGKRMSWRYSDYAQEDDSSMARSTGMVTAFCIEEWLQDDGMIPLGVHPPEAVPSKVVARIIERMVNENAVIQGPEIGK
ncbi:MAG: saccharopine dehydrogenase C-terminal domain-containing protein [Candidatus Thermoplasmatota archaeon]|nr:saccharopine dehydrogenase C-terminal domain-containing protein [Candidatus Thermoplasmatota archaeon]